MPSRSLEIRDFREEDIGELAAIDRVCFPDDIAFSRDELHSYANQPESITRVAERSGRILGFVVARIESESVAHIVTLDVVPGSRRRRVGTSLMNAVHEEFRERNIRVSLLEVGVHNRAARRLYEGLGYRYLGRLPGYYHGREDAYSMGRILGAWPLSR
jgi:ribosomal protein S18 acetylase RimI-like enzyme